MRRWYSPNLASWVVQFEIAPENTCLLAANPLNGNKGSCSGAIQPLATCSIACNDGFETVGAARTCQLGVLSGSAQTCQGATSLLILSTVRPSQKSMHVWLSLAQRSTLATIFLLLMEARTSPLAEIAFMVYLVS